jgi:hypothetical protein
MSETNQAVVLRFIEAMGAGDTEKAAACLAPDAFTQAMGYGKFAGIRHYATIAGTIGALKVLLPTGLRPEVKSVTAAENTVVVEWEGNSTTTTGQAYNNQYCMVFTLRDGKIQQVNEYFCTKLADEVLWPLVEKLSAQIPS